MFSENTTTLNCVYLKLDYILGVRSNLSAYDNSIGSFNNIETPNIDTKLWNSFKYSDLFTINRGMGPRRKDLNGKGKTPFITSTYMNNGKIGMTDCTPMHAGNVISVSRNGSVGEAFYQPIEFCSTEDVHIFTPKFTINKYIALFMITLIRKEKFRYNYGRKWGIQRMNETIIKLPVKTDGQPDFDYMESYIKSLPYSKRI